MPSPFSIKKFFIFIVFFVNLAVIVVLWWTHSSYYLENPEGGNILIALGRVAGLLGEYFLLVMLVLVGRVRWAEHLFGFDKLNKVHRFIGYSILIFLLSHPVLLIVGNAHANNVSLISQFSDFLANKAYVLLSFFALLLFIYVIFLSIAIVRKKLRYETWYFAHLLMYCAVGLAFNHQLGTGDLRSGWALVYWYILNFFVFGSVLLYRFLRPLYRFALHRFYIERVVQETYDTWSMYITGKHMEWFTFDAGQYANITVLARNMWYTHPFSLSQAYNGHGIRFTIKKLGDYTTKIGELTPGTHVIIDGPLGLFIEEKAERDKFLFIAGGIGITPIRAMLESLAQKEKDAVLLYGVKTVNDLVFRKEIDELCARSHTITAHYIIGTPTEGYESGFIDMEKIVRLVPDFFSRDVFLCGPPPMMALMVRNLKKLGFSRHHIHFEKFSF